MFAALCSLPRSSYLALAAMLSVACGDSKPPNTTAMPLPAGTSPAAGSAGPAPVCVRPPGCDDLVTPSLTAKACCTPVTPCGYELPPLDPETEMWFPDAKAQLAVLTQGDPNGRCAPDSFFFGERPGLWDHRVEPEEGEDILVAETCGSYTLYAFILPGCCLPNSTCGLSTDESWSTLESFAPGTPFSKPECVTADVLNQQFRAAGLTALARTIAGGTCNYAALAAAFPPTM